MNLKSKITHQSKSAPDVSFTVRCLNVMQRARRDAAIADRKIRYSQLLADQRALLKAAIPGFYEEEDPNKRADLLKTLAPDKANELAEIQFKAALLLDEHIRPAIVKAGLLSIDGLVLDGQAVTAPEAFLECAPDELLDEVYEACESASSLTDAERKN